MEAINALFLLNFIASNEPKSMVNREKGITLLFLSAMPQISIKN
jgi:hypothetical protein